MAVVPIGGLVPAGLLALTDSTFVSQVPGGGGVYDPLKRMTLSQMLTFIQNSIGGGPLTGPVTINSPPGGPGLMVDTANQTLPTPTPQNTVVQFYNGAGTRLLLDAVGGGTNYTGRAAGGSPGSPAALPINQTISGMFALGYDGAAYTPNAAGNISINTSENWTTSAHGTQIVLSTIAMGTTGPQVNRVVINQGVEVMGSGGPPTGGDMGPGTVNAAGGYYVNGAPIPALTVPTTITGSATLAASNTPNSTIFVNNTTGGFISLTLTTDGTQVVGQRVLIKDVAGNAGVHTCTISSSGTGTTIDSLSNVVLNSDYGSIGLIWKGTEWGLVPGPDPLVQEVSMSAGGTVSLGYSMKQLVLITNTTNAPLTLTLGIGQAYGQEVIFKDAQGNAGAHAITISAPGNNIDGQASVVLTLNYQSLTVLWTGSTWVEAPILPPPPPITTFTDTATFNLDAQQGHIYEINNGSGQPIPLTMNTSAAQFAGQRVLFKDVAGNAGAFPISIFSTGLSSTIDGAANIQLNANYASVELFWTGTTWGIVSEQPPSAASMAATGALSTMAKLRVNLAVAGDTVVNLPAGNLILMQIFLANPSATYAGTGAVGFFTGTGGTGTSLGSVSPPTFSALNRINTAGSFGANLITVTSPVYIHVAAGQQTSSALFVDVIFLGMEA